MIALPRSLATTPAPTSHGGPSDTTLLDTPPRRRTAWWPFTWRLDTADDLTYAIRTGAGVLAFLAAVQVLCVLTNADGHGSVDRGWDALVYGTTAWFLLTKRSRIAAGIALAAYLFGQVLLVIDNVTMWGIDNIRPGWLSVLITAVLVQALRATIRHHRLRHVITPPPDPTLAAS